MNLLLVSVEQSAIILDDSFLRDIKGILYNIRLISNMGSRILAPPLSDWLI